MKVYLKRPQLNRRWLMLGGAIFLGIVATGMSHKVLHDRMAQLDVQVRALNRMVSAVVAKRDLAGSTQIKPAVVVTRADGAAICLWSLDQT
jgi:pilus assembly protein CpaB